MQRRIRIAAGQFAPVRGNIAENIRHHEVLIQSAASAGVDLIVFPELSLTGYEPELAESLALSDDNYLRSLQNLSDACDMTIIAGAPAVIPGDKPAINAFIISPRQPVSHYRKIHLHPGESDYFSSGNEERVFTCHQFSIGLAVCADAGRPEHADNTAQLGAEIYLNAVLSAGGYEKDTELLRGYAAHHQMPTLMANYCGPSGGWLPVGKSAAWNAEGKLVAQAPEDKTALVIVDIHDKACVGEVLLC